MPKLWIAFQIRSWMISQITSTPERRPVPGTENNKVWGARLRRMAARQGMQLAKMRTRDPNASSYGKWHIVGKANRRISGGFSREWTPDDVEMFLTRRGPWKDRP